MTKPVRTSHEVPLPQGYKERPLDYQGGLWIESQMRAYGTACLSAGEALKKTDLENVDLSTVAQKPHDGQHPYVRSMRGCGHGVLFTDYCRDCEIVGLVEQYKRAARTVQVCQDRLRELSEGVSSPESEGKEDEP